MESSIAVFLKRQIAFEQLPTMSEEDFILSSKSYIVCSPPVSRQKQCHSSSSFLLCRFCQISVSAKAQYLIQILSEAVPDLIVCLISIAALMHVKTFLQAFRCLSLPFKHVMSVFFMQKECKKCPMSSVIHLSFYCHAHTHCICKLYSFNSDVH